VSEDQLQKLTPKEKRFCEEYVVDFNGAAAARKAGYSSSRIRQTAYDLLRKSNIREEIRRLQNQLSDKAFELRERLLAELVAVGLANIEDYLVFGPDAVILKDSANISREVLAAISEVTQTETINGTQIKLKLHDKIPAISAAAKMLGLNEPEKKEITGKNGGPIETKDITREELLKSDPRELAALYDEALRAADPAQQES
jgi:phage terminase small subunit